MTFLTRPIALLVNIKKGKRYKNAIREANVCVFTWYEVHIVKSTRMGCCSRGAPIDIAAGSETETNNENLNEKCKMVVWRRKTLTARKMLMVP